MRISIKRTYIRLLTLFAVLGIYSCKKTEFVDYERQPLNRILEYNITNAKQLLQGAIDQRTSVITVYIPYYLSIDHLIADIKLDEGAVLLDSTGAEINLDGGLEPIALGDSVAYKVRSADSVIRTYKIVQKFIPHKDELKAWYLTPAYNENPLKKPVTARFNLYGNFGSASRNAVFTFTEKETGEVYKNFFSIFSVTPGIDYYTMSVNVVPEAKAGTYDVSMFHQGREVALPPVTLFYQRARVGLLPSSSSYAPGDIIELYVISAPSNDTYATVFVGVERMYLKFTQGKVTVPENFPPELYGKEIEMEIVERGRTKIKAIFPEVPPGIYYNSYQQSAGTFSSSGLGFYFDFDEQTDWGKDVLIGAAASAGFEVRSK